MGVSVIEKSQNEGIRKRTKERNGVMHVSHKTDGPDEFSKEVFDKRCLGAFRLRSFYRL